MSRNVRARIYRGGNIALGSRYYNQYLQGLTISAFNLEKGAAVLFTIAILHMNTYGDMHLGVEHPSQHSDSMYCCLGIITPSSHASHNIVV